MRLLLLLLIVLSGCCDQDPVEPQGARSDPPQRSTTVEPQQLTSGETDETNPLVVLAVNKLGRPQVDYYGPDALSYNYSLDTFTLQIGPVGGEPWATVKGQLKLDEANITVTVQSQSERAYDLDLLGISESDDSQQTEEEASELIHIDSGAHELNLERFLIYTYDFKSTP